METMITYFNEHQKWLGLLGGLGAVIVGGFLLFYQPAKAEQVPSVTQLASPVSSESVTTNTGEKTDSSSLAKENEKASHSGTIMVDVKGAVAKPGLYEVNEGSRLADAVAKAGGLTESADSKSINLAQKLTDEMVVYVATTEEAISVIHPTASNTTGDGQQSNSNTGLINLNTATIAELQTISGIGAKRAQDIIDYRDANGGFKTVDDLNQVSGIGDKTMETIRPYVTVD